MSEIESGIQGKLSEYHDGELRALARWRFERRLRRSPELRRELAELSRLGDLVRLAEAAAPGPDLWHRIAQGLPAIDAQRATGASDRASGRLSDRESERGAGLSGWWRPLGAVAAAAAVAFAVYFGSGSAPAPEAGTVRWLDSGGRSVLVLDDSDADLTIIWLLEDAVEGAAQGGSGDVV
jgi:anti-sigma-K factor RskA